MGVLGCPAPDKHSTLTTSCRGHPLHTSGDEGPSPPWAFSTSPALKARPNRGQGLVFAPWVGSDAALITLATGGGSVGHG